MNLEQQMRLEKLTEKQLKDIGVFGEIPENRQALLSEFSKFTTHEEKETPE